MNLFDYPLPEKGSELFTQLLRSRNVVINRIVSSDLREGKWYDQEEDEWLLLLEGEAVLGFDDGEKRLLRGDTLFIPAHQRHCVRRTSERALWLTVHIR